MKALAIIHPGFEEAEAVTPMDLLHRAGVEVVQAAAGGDHAVEGRNGMTLRTPHLLADVIDAEYDAVVLPGGPGIKQLRNDAAICARLRRQRDEGRLIGCICAAPLMLLDAGLLDGVRHTCHFSAESELAEAVREPVVRDGTIITSRGAGTAVEFGLALVEQLCGKASADEVAEAICWPHAR